MNTTETIEKKVMISKTFDEIVEFSNEAYKFIEKAQAEGNGNSKLVYAIKRMSGDPLTQKKGILHKVIKQGQMKSRDLQIDYASVDSVTGNLLKDERGQYLYTKDNRKALDSALEALTGEYMEFEPYIATEIDVELTEDQRELFKGFVIN